MLEKVLKHIRIIKTCNLYLSFFTLGMLMSIMGPCLLDLQHMVRTDTRHIALIYTARSIGYLVGAIFGGILLDVVKSKQSVLMGCNFLATVSMFGIPWSRNVEILLGFMVLNGFSLGALETGANVVCLQLWGKDSDPFFQALHFSFGLGGLVSPLVVAPYLENLEDLSTDNITSSKYSSNFSETVWSYDNYTTMDIPKLIYPFSFLGIVSVLVTALFIAVCIISPIEERTSRSDSNESKKSETKKSSPLMFFAVLFSFLIVFVGIGTEIGFAQTLTAYAVKGKLHTTIIVGSYMTSAYWGAFTISRLVSVFLAIKVNSLTLLVSDISIVAIAGLVLLIFMPNEWALWLASALFGIGIGPFYAVMVGWVKNYINVTNRISAIITVGCAAGEMVGPFIITYFIDSMPDMFVYVTVACSVIVSLLVCMLYCTFKKFPKRVKESKKIECYVISRNSKEKECYDTSIENLTS